MLSALKFKHRVSQFEIAGVPIAKASLYVNYDRRAHIFIGMDILSDWDIHIGISHLLEEVVFLGCPNSRIGKEYQDALTAHFGLIRNVDGVIKSNADREITVTATGGELRAFGSANPCAAEEYHVGRFTSYYGRMLAVLRTGESGQLTLVASARGSEARATIKIV